ncbi:MAG TPA: glycosyltransferase family 4 protein [Gemmatimonadaceae bacterium]
MTSLRFCMVTTFYPPRSFGGDAVAVQSLSRALVRAGHEVTVICDDDAFRTLTGRRDAPPAGGVDGDDGIIVHRLRSALGSVAVGLTQQTGRPIVHGRTLRRLLDEGNFDVIHFHNVSLVGGPAALAYGHAVKLYTAHEHWLVCPTHVLWRHRVEPCTGRECVRCQLRYARPPQLWRHTGLLERHLDEVDAFIAVSAFSRAKHHEFGFSRDMEVIPGFVRDPGVPPRRRAADARPYFLFVGRIESLKGLDDVIDRFRTFEDADLVIAGVGAERAALERRAAGISRVRFVGFQTGQALSDLYSGARGVIASSRGFETFGMSVIEAYSRGVPVLARKLGSYLELVEGSGAGLTFADADELERGMRTLLDDERHVRMGERAYALFRDSYSEDAVLPRYLELVQRFRPFASPAPSLARPGEAAHV